MRSRVNNSVRVESVSDQVWSWTGSTIYTKQLNGRQKCLKLALNVADCRQSVTRRVIVANLCEFQLDDLIGFPFFDCSSVRISNSLPNLFTSFAPLDFHLPRCIWLRRLWKRVGLYSFQFCLRSRKLFVIFTFKVGYKFEILFVIQQKLQFSKT